MSDFEQTVLDAAILLGFAETLNSRTAMPYRESPIILARGAFVVLVWPTSMCMMLNLEEEKDGCHWHIDVLGANSLDQFLTAWELAKDKRRLDDLVISNTRHLEEKHPEWWDELKRRSAT